MKKQYIIKISLILAICLIAGFNKIFAQTTYISGATGNGNFEAAAITPWIYANNPSTNTTDRWIIGTSGVITGTKSAYITNTAGGAYAYTGTTARYQHIYQPISFTAGETQIILTFNWKNNGESSSSDWDNLKVFVSSTIPVGGTANAAIDQVGATWYNVQTTVQSASITLPASLAGTSKYLIFQWKCDASGAYQPPASIDDIVLTSAPCAVQTIPYTESFESITAANTLPTCMAATNIGTKVYTYIAPTGSYNQAARTGTDFASFKYSCDDWIYTQGLALTSGVTYNFSFWYVTDGLGGWTTLNAFFGNAQNSGAMTTAITGATVSGPTNTSYVQLSGTFTPSSTGTFYCGIHCLSNSTPWYLSIDDINVTASTPMIYSSCTTTQLNTTDVAPGATAQEIIGIQIVTTGSTSPLSVTQFTVNANGTTAIADINAANSAKIYYTGTSSTFATTTYFGQNTPTIANFVINGSQVLSSGTNYFWLVYDIKAGATLGDVVDGQCTSLNVGVARTPTVTAPAGNRPIALAYCTNTNTVNTSYYIDDFSTTGGTTNITNNNTGFSANGYGNFTGMSASAMQGTSINFSITEMGGTMGFGIWVDWNKDGDFADAGEEVYMPGSYQSTATGSFTVPLTATVGNTRMRVVGNELSTTPTACTGTSYTECEDYTFTVIALPVCAGTPTAGTATATPNSICAPATSTLSLSGYTVASGITFQWQSAPAAGGPWTNIVGATSTTQIVSPTVTTYYRCVVTCTNSGLSANTVAVSVTVAGPSYAPIGYTCGFNTNWVSRCDVNEIPDNYWVANPVTSDDSWRRNNDGATAAWTTPTNGAYTPVSSEGTRSARFHSYYSSAVATLDLYIDLSTQTGTKLLSFDYINTSGTDILDVLFSTDGGLTFPTTLNSVTTAAAWTTYYADLASNSATCVIRFRATGDNGSTDIGLDAVSITPPCSGAPTAGTASSNIANFCNTGTPTISVSGYSISGGITFQWESSVTNSPYSWSVITGGQATSYTASPAINQTTYYRCAVSCGASTSYTNIVTVSNSAQSITGTNSPVTVTCNTAANMTATASGGTISWYANATGGSAIATGGSYSPVVTANTTYYCAAGSGGSTSNVGEVSSPLSDGYYGSTNTGLVFDAISAFTLVSVNVYVQTASSNVRIQFQDNTGTAIGSDYIFNNCPAGLNTLTLNISVPVGTGYRLVSNNTTYLARDFTSAFPYTQAGICSITGAVLGGSSSTTYYFFYDWVISTGCESSPRTPVNVIVSGGVTAPVCSGTPSPSNNATGVCPISTIISWSASTTACRTATGYKLYFGTDAAATNIYNGLDIGLVTSYNLGSLSGSTAYFWRIVPYNTAGDGACATVWKFTTAANPGNICITNMGTGVISVASLPYASGNGTTKNKVNDLTAANTVTCGSSSYLGGEDQVFVFTPALSGSITITVTSTGTYTGLMLYDGCPLLGTVCGATQGSCIGYSQGYDGTRSLTVCVTAGITYYLVLDSYPAPDWNAYSNLTISAPTGSVATNDLPCNAISLTLGGTTNGNNSCTGGSSEPSTPSCWTYGLLNTIWYTAVCPASGKLTITTTLGTLTNTQIAVFSGSCSSLTLVSGACNDNISGCGSSNASMLQLTGLTPGATYYISVDGAYDLIGSFDITVIDGNSSLPTTMGQDCSAPLPTCATMLNVADPGYSGTGSICDFDGTYDCTGGDRAAVFYTIDIASAGQLMFDIVPNDYSGGFPGDGTDYDFIIWKTAGSGTLATCASISTNSSIGMVACNYSYIDVTGLYTGGNAPALYGSGFDGAYEAPITVAAGDQYLLWISNFSLSTSGFTIDYANSTPSAAIINIAAVPTLVAWTGSTSTAWNLAANWGGCGVPNTCATSVVVPAYQPLMPVISTNISVNDLTINSGATLTVNSGNTLTICGNFTNNGTFTVNGTGRVIFAGTAPQTCTNNSGTLTIPNVTINNTGGGVTLAGSAGNMIVTTNFTLTSGILNTSSSAMLIMNAGTTLTPATGGSSTSYVDGPMQKLGNSAFVFPLGDGTRWARLAMTAPTASTTFQAEYFATPYSNLTPMDLTQGAATLNHVSNLEYWQLNRIAGTGNASVTLYWESAAFSGISLCASYLDLSVAKWTGAAWTNLNTTAATITGTCGTFGTIKTQADVTTFSPFTFGSLKTPAQNPLPVELISFTGKRIGETNILEWKTASEFNNDYFILLRSKDGKKFEDLAKIEGNGNSNSIITYSQDDNFPYNPITYYKLKQVDINGFYKYSNVISISNTDGSDKPELLELYPNPSSALINIVVYSPDESLVSLELIDIYGKMVQSLPLKVKKGRDVLSIDISNLANGVYATKILFTNYNITGYKRFIKK